MNDESPSTPKTRVEPRLVVAGFVMIAVLIAALVGDPTTSSTVVRVDRASVLAPAVVVTGTDIRSTAWYCPIASTSEHIVDDAVVVANLTERHATVELSAIAASKIVGRRTVELPGNGTLSIKVSDLAGGRDVGVVVESFGSAIVVEHVGGDGRSSAATPCATEPSGTWYFAAGSTRLGTRERVASEREREEHVRVACQVEVRVFRRRVQELDVRESATQLGDMVRRHRPRRDSVVHGDEDAHARYPSRRV